jgi:hypothetical protein
MSHSVTESDFIPSRVRHSISRPRMTIMLSLFILSVSSGFAQKVVDLAAYKANLQRQEEGLLVQYGKDLDSAMAGLKQKGELDAYLVFAEEKKRFETENTVPFPADTVVACRPTVESYHKYKVELLRKYSTALDGLIQQLMVADKIEEAKETKAEKERAAFMLADPRWSPHPLPFE